MESEDTKKPAGSPRPRQKWRPRQDQRECASPLWKQRRARQTSPPPEAAAGGTTPAVRAGPGPGLTPPAPTTVTFSIMDTVVPTIPDVTADDIERKMPYPTLTKCEDAPTYSTISTIREEMFHNSIAVKSTFGGGGGTATTAPSRSSRTTSSRRASLGRSQRPAESTRPSRPE